MGRDHRLVRRAGLRLSRDGAVINADWVKAGAYEVNVGGRLYPISVSLRPLYDPANERIRP